MRKRRAYAVLAGAALIMACTLSFTAFAKEERTPVGKIKLNFTSDIQAGEIGGNVDVTLEDGECSIESVDIINEGDNWVGGDKPKVEIWLSADLKEIQQIVVRISFSLRPDVSAGRPS